MSVSPANSATPEEQREQPEEGQQQQQQAEPLENAGSIFPELSRTLFAAFTDENLRHARVLSAAARGEETDAVELKAAQECEQQVGTSLRHLVEPPRLDWIITEDKWDVFGETWPIHEQLPTLADSALVQLYDSAQDRRQALQQLLHTLLVTHAQIIASLLEPPLSRKGLEYQAANGATAKTELDMLSDHIRLTAINMHHLLNELRPVQARESLLALKQAELERTRTQLAQLKLKCTKVEEIISQLDAKYKSSTNNSNATRAAGLSPGAAEFAALLAKTDAI